MMKAVKLYLLTMLVLLAVVASSPGQEENPHIGYVYPAGGQAGTVFRVLLGGQRLDGAKVVLLSGEHLDSSDIQVRVVDYMRPLNQGHFKEMQNRMGELMKKKMENAPEGVERGRRGSSQSFTNEKWTEEDEKALAEIQQKLATFAIRRFSVPSLVETVELEVSIDKLAEPGMREMRLQTDNGLSNPIAFFISQLPEFSEESGRDVAEEESQKRGERGRKRQQTNRPSPGTTPLSAVADGETRIELPMILNGQILPGDVDRYRFLAQKGQHLVVDVSARSLIPYLSDAVPGWFQAVVSLSDANGNEMTYEDDFRFHPDPVLHCEIPEDGEYVLEIKDALYRGREDFVYRVAVGELPYITDIYPLGGRAGVKTQVELTGWNIDKSAVDITCEEAGIHPVSIDVNGVLSNQLPFIIDNWPEMHEKEGNNSASDAQLLTIPIILNGRSDQAGDMDVYKFEGKGGQRIVAEIKARRLGSSLDSILKATTGEGKSLGVNDDNEDKTAGLVTHHADSRLQFTIPADGTICLLVADSQGGGGRDYGYRLYLNEVSPDFEMRVVPSSINVRAGATVPFTVHVMRKDGFSGEIALNLKDAPKGFTLGGSTIPAGQDIVRMTLTVPPESVDKIFSLSLEGQAYENGQLLVRPALPADDVMQAFIYRHLVPAKECLVAVTGSARNSALNLLNKDTIKIPRNGAADVSVSVPRRTVFGELHFELDNPPSGISIEKVSMGRGECTIRLRCDSTVAPDGLKGNLIVNAFAVKAGEDSGKGKEQHKKTRILLSSLPAIPYEVASK